MTEYEIACLGKTRFPSRRAARRRLRFRAYRCPFCLGTHIGHTPGHATYLRKGPHGPVPIQEHAA